MDNSMLANYEHMAKLCRKMKNFLSHEVPIAHIETAKRVADFYAMDFVKNDFYSNYFFCLYFKYRTAMIEYESCEDV